MKKIMILAVVSAILSACSPRTAAVLYTPAATDATELVSYEQLTAGRNLFVSKCAKCHKLKMPETRNEAQWIKALDKMQPKAKINDEEKQQILDFVLVKAKKTAS